MTYLLEDDTSAMVGGQLSFCFSQHFEYTNILDDTDVEV
jgi:hypothetical protein